MLIAGVLKFDAQGRIILSVDAPVYFNGGTPTTADGSLATSVGGDPDTFIAAIGYEDDGRICDSNNPLTPSVGPISNDLGQIRVSTEPPAYWYAGLPFTAEGLLSTSTGIDPPPDLGAFDDSFDNSFDIGD